MLNSVESTLHDQAINMSTSLTAPMSLRFSEELDLGVEQEHNPTTAVAWTAEDSQAGLQNFCDFLPLLDPSSEDGLLDMSLVSADQLPAADASRRREATAPAERKEHSRLIQKRYRQRQKVLLWKPQWHSFDYSC